VPPTTPDLTGLIQRGVDAVNARDAEALATLGTPDGVYDLSPLGLGTFEGRAATRAFFDEHWPTFEDYELDLEEVSDLGGGFTLGLFRQRSRLRGSAA